MGTQYSHLSNFERCRLFEWYHYQKKSIREVSRLLNRSHRKITWPYMDAALKSRRAGM